MMKPGGGTYCVTLIEYIDCEILGIVLHDAFARYRAVVVRDWAVVER